MQLIPGITPAYAGKSFHVKNNFVNIKDHPRLCGEKQVMNTENENPIGSPPPMRGKGCRTQNAAGQPGITPAYAGKRCPCCTKSAAYWDHPRLCGEKLCFACCRGSAAGSPPPMRGKVLKFLKETSLTGITPAYAGKRQNCSGQSTIF